MATSKTNQIIFFVGLLHSLAIIHAETADNIYITDCKNTEVTIFTCSNNATKDKLQTILAEEQMACDPYIVIFRKVKQVHFESCGFETLPDGVLAKFSAVEEISITSSKLTALRVQDLPPVRPKLVALELRSCEIAAIDVDLLKAIPKLRHLDLFGNAIAKVTAELAHAPNLEYVNLGFNRRIQIGADAFRGLPKLRTLRLSSTGLASAAIPLDRGTDLRTLVISGNPIVRLYATDFSHLPHLEVLQCMGCQLVAIGLGTFAALANLESLDLSYNNLDKIDFDNFLPAMPFLRSLDLEHSHLTELDFNFERLFPELEFLRLNYNPFNCTYLREFSASLRSRSQALDVNLFEALREPNVRGIVCKDVQRQAPAPLSSDAAEVEQGFGSSYNVSIFVLMLFIGAVHLAICAAIVRLARKAAQN